MRRIKSIVSFLAVLAIPAYGENSYSSSAYPGTPPAHAYGPSTYSTQPNGYTLPPRPSSGPISPYSQALAPTQPYAYPQPYQYPGRQAPNAMNRAPSPQPQNPYAQPPPGYANPNLNQFAQSGIPSTPQRRTPRRFDVINATGGSGSACGLTFAAKVPTSGGMCAYSAVQAAHCVPATISTRGILPRFQHTIIKTPQRISIPTRNMQISLGSQYRSGTNSPSTDYAVLSFAYSCALIPDQDIAPIAPETQMPCSQPAGQPIITTRTGGRVVQGTLRQDHGNCVIRGRTNEESVIPGDSGGPITDANGYIVGVVSTRIIGQPLYTYSPGAPQFFRNTIQQHMAKMLQGVNNQIAAMLPGTGPGPGPGGGVPYNNAPRG